MSRMIGTVSRGVRAPIIKAGDDIVEIVTSSVLEAAKEDNIHIGDLITVGVDVVILRS